MQYKTRGVIMLLLTAIVWGLGYVAQSDGMNYVKPFTYNAVRTLLAGFMLIPVIVLFRTKERKSSGSAPKAPLKITIIGGIICGIIFFLASMFQQIGITMTTAGKAGFITSLYIVIVPVISVIIFRKSKLKIWICCLMTVIGFYFLCINENFSISVGDLLVLACALFFAIHIMVIDHFNARNVNCTAMACVQFFTAGILMLVCMFIFEHPDIDSLFSAWLPILYGGVMSCGVAYTLQILGQKYTDPTVAPLLLSLESVFAALSGWLILNEQLSLKEMIGCVLVFIAVILAQIRLKRRKKVEKEQNLCILNEESA